MKIKIILKRIVQIITFLGCLPLTSRLMCPLGFGENKVDWIITVIGLPCFLIFLFTTEDELRADVKRWFTEEDKK